MIKEVGAVVSRWFEGYPVRVRVLVQGTEGQDFRRDCPLFDKVYKTGMDVFVKNKMIHNSCAVCSHLQQDACLPHSFILKAITIDKRVASTLLVTALDGKETWLNENYDQVEKQLDFCTEWLSHKFENEQRKKEHHSMLAELNGVFSMIQDPILIVGTNGTIHNLSHPAGILFHKARTVLMGENIIDIIGETDWLKIKNMKKQQELKVTVKSTAGMQGELQTRVKIAAVKKDEFLATVKPLLLDEKLDSFLIKLTPKIESNKKRQEQRVLYSFQDVKGTSDVIENAKGTAKRIALSDVTVLLRGESGTGKEVFAQSIHQASDRKEEPFIAINCAAIPESLLESELFGHVKGAFTGSLTDKPGRFELANGGTIFLDEIGDLPFPLQAKLLRVVQERKIERVGDTKSTLVNVRIITATHRNLEELVANGQFREDLYYRLNVIPITIPPLRERREDIPLLIDHFLDKFSKEHFRSPKRLSEEVYELLLSHPWPGNIRELQNVVHHFVQLEIGDLVTMESLPDYLKTGDVRNHPMIVQAQPLRGTHTAKTDTPSDEKERIIQLLDQFGRDTAGKKRVASSLNISLPTLYRKIGKLKIK